MPEGAPSYFSKPPKSVPPEEPDAAAPELPEEPEEDGVEEEEPFADSVVVADSAVCVDSIGPDCGEATGAGVCAPDSKPNSASVSSAGERRGFFFFPAPALFDFEELVFRGCGPGAGAGTGGAASSVGGGALTSGVGG